MANFLLRSITVLGTMYGMLFGFTGIIAAILFSEVGIVIGGLAMTPWTFAIFITLALGFIQFLIAPWFMDLQLRWMYNMSWIGIEQLPIEMREALMQSMQKFGYNIGKIGIIHDGAPNAFTYGRFRNNARIVFTQGIIDLLEPNERVGVLEHELGHIINGDFFMMTLAQMIPILFYGLYSRTQYFARMLSRAKSRGSGNSQSGNAASALYAIAAIAYILYFISTYMVAYISRLRESAADNHSARETRDPNGLASALVKIAYGLVVADAATQAKLDNKETSKDERKAASNSRGLMYGYRAMGISDVKTARGLVMTAYGGGAKEVDPDVVAAAASWDLSTPWAKYVELSSTHPLTGKRLKNLNDIAPELGQDPKYPALGTVKPPENLWDEFLADLAYLNLVPPMLIVLPIVGAVVSSLFALNPVLGAGLGLIAYGLLWLRRTAIQYPNVDDYDDPQRPTNTVLEALTSMEKDMYYEASPIRGKPIVLEGIVRGRGSPGYILGDDFVVQDATGFITINYKSLFSLYGLWFGYKHVQQMMGQKVRVIGWYHRSMGPYVSMYKLYRPNGKVNKNRWRGANRIWAFIVIGVGVFLSLLSFGII